MVFLPSCIIPCHSVVGTAPLPCTPGPPSTHRPLPCILSGIVRTMFRTPIAMVFIAHRPPCPPRTPSAFASPSVALPPFFFPVAAVSHLPLVSLRLVASPSPLLRVLTADSVKPHTRGPLSECLATAIVFITPWRGGSGDLRTPCGIAWPPLRMPIGTNSCPSTPRTFHSNSAQRPLIVLSGAEPSKLRRPLPFIKSLFMFTLPSESTS